MPGQILSWYKSDALKIGDVTEETSALKNFSPLLHSPLLRASASSSSLSANLGCPDSYWEPNSHGSKKKCLLPVLTDKTYVPHTFRHR